MKRTVSILVLVMVLAISVPSMAADMSKYNIVTSADTHKVIFDTDMGYFGDDTYAMFILLQADAAGYIDLLGVTSTGGNVTIGQGTTAILNQLEALGRDDIPVYIGTDVPIMGLWFDDITVRANGLTQIRSMKNVIDYGQTTTWDNLGPLKNEAWGYSSLSPQEGHAWEFMIEQVHKYPGQVTIMAVGAATNVAIACLSDPTFAENTAGIYWMGGAIDVPGNDTSSAERNWYYDPHAVKISLQQPFPKQVIIPHDISHYQRLTKEIMDGFAENNNTVYTELIVEHAYPRFENDPGRSQRLWDAQVPGVFLVPDLIASSDERYVGMVTEMGYSFGESVFWMDSGEMDDAPSEAGYATIVYDVHGDQYWEFVVDLLSTEF
ncbi:MAG: nucleoside hydrolase [Syntrophomonadaceae bacterium]|jgi:inosine-uridine nucleoside N-ribohydrolase|nr:nucleoside hydrolase [Syntrophomonadaceae bacterium]